MNVTNMKLLVTILAFTCICGCASHATVTGQKRDPINPDTVKFYDEPPANYEVVGIVEAMKFEFISDDDADAQFVLGKLKKEAAKIGANGVIDWEVWDVTTGGWTPSTSDPFDTTHYTRKVAKGTAIHVPSKNCSE